nr:LacI family DNA-binding transcriptional regulator [uncultured Blautia sp.]
MAERVTIQDIADALGLSRNTVSKAINNTGILADTTREKVLKKAFEMGYKQFSYASTLEDITHQEQIPSETAPNKEIALFTTKFLGDSHFASTMLDKFQREISQMGYSLSMHRVLKNELEQLKLPASFELGRTSGIICYEIFDHAYSRMLCALEIPTLFVDTPVAGLNEPLKADKLYMDNQSGIYSFIQEMIHRGKTRFGFVGEHLHCQSFWERYMAFRNSMFLLNQPYIEEYCMLGNKEGVENPDSADYQDYLLEHFRALKELPEVLICANDFIALDVINVLRQLNYKIPDDIMLCGFDDSPESKIVSPPLTTIHIHTQIMGYSAVHLLMSRIKNPSLNYRTIYTETNLIYRESTGD